MIQLTQTLTKEDYKKAAAVHFRTTRSNSFRPRIGLALAVLGAYLLYYSLVISSANWLAAAFLVGYGVYSIFERQIWIWRMANSNAEEHSSTFSVNISDDGRFTVESGENRDEIQIGDLDSFVRSDDGFLLYDNEIAFTYLKFEAFQSSAQIDDLEALLEEAGVPELELC